MSIPPLHYLRSLKEISPCLTPNYVDLTEQELSYNNDVVSYKYCLSETSQAKET